MIRKTKERNIVTVYKCFKLEGQSLIISKPVIRNILHIVSHHKAAHQKYSLQKRSTVRWQWRHSLPSKKKKKNGHNRPFPSSLGPLYQNEIMCSAFDIETIFHSQANKTHFRKKGCALGLIFKVRVLEFESDLFSSNSIVTVIIQ